jgi:hypothetical protein
VRACRGGHALISVYPGDAREVRGQFPGEHAGPAADVDGDLAPGGQVAQDPVMEVLVVIPGWRALTRARFSSPLS